MGMHAPVAEQVRQSGTGPERWKDGKTKDGNFFFSDLTLNIVGPSLLPFGVSEGVMTASCSLGSQSQDMLCIQGDVKLSLPGVSKHRSAWVKKYQRVFLRTPFLVPRELLPHCPSSPRRSQTIIPRQSLGESFLNVRQSLPSSHPCLGLTSAPPLPFLTERAPDSPAPASLAGDGQEPTEPIPDHGATSTVSAPCRTQRRPVRVRADGSGDARAASPSGCGGRKDRSQVPLQFIETFAVNRERVRKPSWDAIGLLPSKRGCWRRKQRFWKCIGADV